MSQDSVQNPLELLETYPVSIYCDKLIMGRGQDAKHNSSLDDSKTSSNVGMMSHQFLLLTWIRLLEFFLKHLEIEPIRQMGSPIYDIFSTQQINVR